MSRISIRFSPARRIEFPVLTRIPFTATILGEIEISGFVEVERRRGPAFRGFIDLAGTEFFRPLDRSGNMFAAVQQRITRGGYSAGRYSVARRVVEQAIRKNKVLASMVKEREG